MSKTNLRNPRLAAKVARAKAKQPRKRAANPKPTLEESLARLERMVAQLRNTAEGNSASIALVRGDLCAVRAELERLATAPIEPRAPGVVPGSRAQFSAAGNDAPRTAVEIIGCP